MPAELPTYDIPAPLAHRLMDLCGESLLEAIAQIDLGRKIGTYEEPIVWVAYAA